MRTKLALLFLAFIFGPGCGDAAGPDPSDEPAAQVGLGPGANLGGRRPFPADNPWNRDVSEDPIDPNSAALIASCGLRNLHPDFGTVWKGAPNGAPYVVVSSRQEKVPVTFRYASESDPGPYPIPVDAPIEGGPSATGDRHVIVIDRDNWVLYELFDAHPVDGGASWRAGSGGDLRSEVERPASGGLDLRGCRGSAHLSGSRALRRGCRAP